MEMAHLVNLFYWEKGLQKQTRILTLPYIAFVARKNVCLLFHLHLKR